MPTIFAGEEVLVAIIGSGTGSGIADDLAPDQFDDAVLGTEEGNFDVDVESFQGQLGRDRMLEGIGEIGRRVEHPSIIDVGHIDLNGVLFGHCDLWGFDGDAALSGDAADGDFGHPSEQGGRGQIGTDARLLLTDIIGIVEESRTA
jgi:hypothetical protein